MSSVAIESLTPTAVWKIFVGIAAVPRPSKQEARIRKHVREFAESQGLQVREEPIGNLIIDVPATKGHENAPVTVLQAHLDMVCEKNRDTQHDFDHEGIKLRLDTDAKSGQKIVRAEGTTLGADNGIGVALALAAATEKDVVHGPLELLLTIDEEAGMSGAKALTPTSFRGRRLLNLDSEEDNAIYIGCAGGCDTNLTWKLSTSPVDSALVAYRVVVDGLRGGHSGSDIHENRANAIKLVGRVLARVDQGTMRLVELVGGSKRNAIPRESHAVVFGPSGLLRALQEAGSAVAAASRVESFEDGVRITVEQASDTTPKVAATASETNALIAAIVALPSGVLGMHPRVPNLVQTSNNVSTVDTRRGNDAIEIVVGCLSRSSSSSLLDLTARQIASIGRLAGATAEHGNTYPGWEPNPDSPTLAVCKRVYERLFKESPHILAIHAGLECGIIGERVGRMDMVSFGPNITGAHSPDERVYVDSVAKSWKYLTAVLAELAKSAT